MPLITDNPATDEQDHEYPNLLTSLAIQGRVVGQDIVASVALKGVPYRFDENGDIVVHNSRRAFVTQDAFADAQNDPVLAQAVSKIMAAIQEFYTLKGM